MTEWGNPFTLTPAPKATAGARRPSEAEKRASLSDLARTARCPRCKAAVLEARCDAIDLLADPIALSPVMELLALCAGRWSLDARRTGNRWRLALRDDARLRARGGERTHPVIVTHVCGQPMTGTPLPKATRSKAAASDTPAF